MILGSGVTRTVHKVGPWAVKRPGGWGGYRPAALLRGWLANRSEWKQRHRPDVARPRWTLFYIVQGYPIGRLPDQYLFDLLVSGWLRACGYSAEEAKPSSWAYFDRPRLIDSDRAWQHPRGIIGAIYYGNQERLARKWMRLPS